MTSLSADEAKFRTAFDAHLDAINRYCVRRIAASDVNDVVADVFAVAWHKVDQMPDGDGALPWLYRVARNELSNRHRSARRLRTLTERLKGHARDTDLGPEPVIVRGFEIDRLMVALRTLSSGDQEVLLLSTHEELTHSQMALALACTPEAARKRLSRALRRLRRAADIPEQRSAVSGTRAIERGGDQ